MKDLEQVHDAKDKHADNKEWLDNKWSGMTYADGVEAALGWVVGEQTDEEFLGELPK